MRHRVNSANVLPIQTLKGSASLVRIGNTDFIAGRYAASLLKHLPRFPNLRLAKPRPRLRQSNLSVMPTPLVRTPAKQE